MKKFSFTIQVFGLMAMVPTFVILEMSHGTGKLPENKNIPVGKEKVETTILLEAKTSEANYETLSGKIQTGS